MKKFKSLASTSKKVMALLSVSALSISMLCSCGQEEISTTTETEITEEISEETTTAAETEEEITDEVSTIPDEYLADYPLHNESVSVFIKCPDGLGFYPDAIIDTSNTSCQDMYDNYNTIMLHTSDVNYDPNSEDGYRDIEISYSLNPEMNIDWYRENKELGWNNGSSERFEIAEPETLDNGIIINKIEVISTREYNYGEIIFNYYILTYSIDEDNTIEIYFSNHVEDQAESVLDFYRSEDNPFFIINSAE